MVVTAVAIIMAILWFQKEIHIQSNIFKLLPALSSNPKLIENHEKISKELNSQVFILLESQEYERLNHATTQVLASAKQSQLWQPIEHKQDLTQFSQQLFDYRAGLVSPHTQQLLEQKQYDALIEQSMLQLLSPSFPISEQLLKDDPLLLFPQYLMDKAQQQQVNIQLEQGFPTIYPDENSEKTQNYARLMIFNVVKSPYDIDYQQQVVQWFEQTQQQLQAEKVKLIWSGTLAFASAGTQSAKTEISTIGLGSSFGVVLLVLFGFRSLRPLFTEFIAVSVGSLMAFAVTHFIFGEIHLMTLVFGASLIGASVDFSFYFMAMQAQHRDKQGFDVLKPLLPSLFLGLMTTIIGYLFLSITPFPAFKQIAVFSAVGLFAAWLTSILLLPRLKPLNAEPAVKRLSILANIRQCFMQRQALRYALVIGIVVLSVLGLSQLKFNDDIRNLQSANAQLKADDQHIRQLFGQNGGSDYLLITADNIQQLDEIERDLIQKLTVLQQQQVITQFQAIGQWFNPLLQQQNIQLLQQIPYQKLKQYADTMGLNFQDILIWQQQLSQQPALTMVQFQAHPLAKLALSPTERMIVLHGIQQREVVAKLENAQIHFMQPTYQLSQQFAEHRIHAQWLLLGAMLSVAGLIWFLYGIKSVLPIMLPVSLALALTFALQALIGVQLNLFSIMGCFLILGIGVDYAIFYRHEREQYQVVVMALFLCMMSTLLGFGLLALSHTYAIFCFGLTVLCGVIFSYIFATCLTPSDREE